MRESMFSYWITSNGRRAEAQRRGVETTWRQEADCWQTDLAPHQHGTEDDLEAVEEVVAYDDDCGAPRGPALAGTDGFNAGRRSWWERETNVGGSLALETHLNQTSENTTSHGASKQGGNPGWAVSSLLHLHAAGCRPDRRASLTHWHTEDSNTEAFSNHARMWRFRLWTEVLNDVSSLLFSISNHYLFIFKDFCPPFTPQLKIQSTSGHIMRMRMLTQA